MLIIFAGLQSIDENMIAAARVDGASAWQMLRFITLCRPSPPTC
jgi:ABC-type sugar transport system permease subunit